MAITRNLHVGPYRVHVTVNLTVEDDELALVLEDVEACVRTALTERSRALPIEVHGKVRVDGEVVGRWFGQR